jgi:hypothetical protein
MRVMHDMVKTMDIRSSECGSIRIRFASTSRW